MKKNDTSAPFKIRGLSAKCIKSNGKSADKHKNRTVYFHEYVNDVLHLCLKVYDHVLHVKCEVILTRV